MREMVPVVAEDVPEEEAEALLEKLADGIVRRQLAIPAVLLLETCKPLNFVGSQAMIALHPFVAAFVKGDDYRKVALLMEEDANVEELLQRVERKEAAVKAAEKRERSGDGTFARAWARVRGGKSRGDSGE
ncbi:hypothetical protein HN371_23675 [Candidatus Poribacteria bacterium]|jgi:hypothetical protein|nr:hypothetical protein [Candidatus Poribacteria bacterium]MBT5534016.1 hypothetical protein [Candidatus Poribacteria bacterium]MBT5709679.1 hypothetical protein [Candidatus Poribacteria bacterium]MBT7099921.1 hypothetical protein [Candidatus Poribacteria bacterium]MBT7804714.1 hypothetical protein [Candidatus Poribacteria bacterium]